MPWFKGNSNREVLRCYYEFHTRRAVGPVGDGVEAGLYYTNEPFPTMEAVADNAWYKLANGTIEHRDPQIGAITHQQAMWIELKAKYLNWAMVK